MLCCIGGHRTAKLDQSTPAQWRKDRNNTRVLGLDIFGCWWRLGRRHFSFCLIALAWIFITFFSHRQVYREKKRFVLLKSNSTCALIKSQLKHDGRPDLACWGPTHQPCPQLWPLRRQRFCSPCRWTHRACWCPVWFYWTVTWSACTYSHWENSWGLPGPGLCPRWWWECWGTACDGGWVRTSWWWREEEGRRTCGWHAVTWAALHREVCCSGRWQRKAPKSCRNR